MPSKIKKIVTGDTLLIKNGTICDHVGRYSADILIENGKVKAIGSDLPAGSHEVLDAEGGFLLPGGVDVHTHMDLDLGRYRAIDDFYTGTVAAAFGGTTTIVDHLAFGPKDCSLKHQIEQYHALAVGKSVIDYSFHGVIQHVDDEILKEMGELVRDGITSFKIYMTYDNMLDDESILKALIRAKELDAVIAVHAENDGAIHYLREQYGNAGKTAPFYHTLSRPDSAEAEAINRVICLSEIADFPHVYFVHVSTKKGLDVITSARERGVENIYCETCTQYLMLTEDKYKGGCEEGLKYIMAPPLRKKEDVEALWKGIERNDVDVIATDHCPFFLKQKLDGMEDFRIAPGGVPGVEERMEIILTEGTRRGVPLGRLIDKLSTRPAVIYGLFPNKGTIRPGSDADLIIVKDKKKMIRQDNRHGASDYTVYEGFATDFSVEAVIQRGNILMDKGTLTIERGAGIFLKRENAQLI